MTKPTQLAFECRLTAFDFFEGYAENIPIRC